MLVCLASEAVVPIIPPICRKVGAILALEAQLWPLLSRIAVVAVTLIDAWPTSLATTQRALSKPNTCRIEHQF